MVLLSLWLFRVDDDGWAKIENEEASDDKRATVAATVVADVAAN
jgi:hypothetical protein